MDAPKIPMPGADPGNARQNYYNIPFNVFAFFRLSLDATMHVPQHQPTFLSYITLVFLRQTYGNPQFSSCVLKNDFQENNSLIKEKYSYFELRKRGALALLFGLRGYVPLGLFRLQNSRFFIQNQFKVE